jgi:hypothetical protein
MLEWQIEGKEKEGEITTSPELSLLAQGLA